MAKKDDKPKITIERTYNIPLRKEFQKVPKYKRAKKAVTALRKFLTRHMKSDKIKLGKHLNELVWNNGIKNPPHHVNVSVVKEDNGTVRAELIGKPIYEDEPVKPKKVAAVKEDKKSDKKETKKEEAPKTEGKKSESLEEIAGVKEDKKEEKPEDKKVEEKKVEEPKAEKKEEEKVKEPKTEEKKEEPSTKESEEKPSKEN
jgi:large subunit ribosomal protein L31e